MSAIPATSNHAIRPSLPHMRIASSNQKTASATPDAMPGKSICRNCVPSTRYATKPRSNPTTIATNPIQNPSRAKIFPREAKEPLFFIHRRERPQIEDVRDGDDRDDAQ